MMAPRRPYRSDRRPHIGADASCAIEKTAIIQPITHSCAWRRSA